jgi:hypothetical protein
MSSASIPIPANYVSDRQLLPLVQTVTNPLGDELQIPTVERIANAFRVCAGNNLWCQRPIAYTLACYVFSKITNLLQRLFKYEVRQTGVFDSVG